MFINIMYLQLHKKGLYFWEGTINTVLQVWYWFCLPTKRALPTGQYSVLTSTCKATINKEVTRVWPSILPVFRFPILTRRFHELFIYTSGDAHRWCRVECKAIYESASFVIGFRVQRDWLLLVRVYFSIEMRRFILWETFEWKT